MKTKNCQKPYKKSSIADIIEYVTFKEIAFQSETENKQKVKWLFCTFCIFLSFSLSDLGELCKQKLIDFMTATDCGPQSINK